MTVCAAIRTRVVCPGGSKQRNREGETDRERQGERCSSEAQPHLLFMTHRKSFSVSSRWYPGSKHNTQPSEHKSAWPGSHRQKKWGVVSRVLLPVVLMSLGCKGCQFSCLCFDFSFFFFFSPSIPSSPSVSVSQVPQSSPRFPQTRSECQGAWHHLCARPLVIPSLPSTGTRRAKRSTPSVSRWLSQCSIVKSYYSSMTNRNMCVQ